MKRARIKATVTVPTRRKATQDSSVSEVVNVAESTEENRNVSNNVALKPISENDIHNIEKKQVQENSLIEEQTQSEQVSLSNQNIDCKDEAKQSSDEVQKKEIIQSLETSTTTQNASPTKSAQGRLGFIRPTPKLDSGDRVKRNSVQGSGASASESEDDSKRIISTSVNNAKNDLVHSTQNVKDVVVNNSKNNIKSKIGQKRRMLVSESAKKLAEARKEFQLKHENKTPDRSKLTMYDLIYYNPVTNPMKRSKESGTIARRISECKSEEERHEEENEDDPPDGMPAPQVKVGSDGQLIIDEQSLVIEQTNTKKGREALAKEAIIDDDSSSGFYKKRQKSKEWPKWETLKFYKALNTVGTDFLLMQSLFPNRTRQEIKLKFKKEEKVNRNLVEKALAYHQEFDTEILEKSLATFEHSEKEYFDTQKKQKGSKEKKNGKSERKRKCRLVASSIALMDASDNEEDQPSEFSTQDENTKTSDDLDTVKKGSKRRKKSREEKKTLEEPVTEMDNTDLLSSCTGCDSDTEVYHVRPTRSGRLPKVKKLQGPDINALDNEKPSDDCSDNEIITSSNVDVRVSDDSSFNDANNDSKINETSENSVKTIIPNIGHVEPGSLVILSKESPEEPGKSVLQVYMVSSNIDSSQNFEESNMTPVNLPPELLATVTTRLSDAESITVKKECE